MDLQTLREVQNELIRFQSKMDAAFMKAQENKGQTFTSGPNKGQMFNVGCVDGTKESAALKRAAMDLKNELHKITAK